MTIDEWFDTSMYCGTTAQARYLAATNGTERKAALREMPDATVKCIEVPEGEPFSYFRRRSTNIWISK